MNIRQLTRTIAAAALSVVLLAGCDGILDTEPQQSISEEMALSTPNGVQNALVGAYNMLGNEDLYGGRFQLLETLYGDDGEVNWTGTFTQPRQVWLKSIFPSNLFIQYQWVDSYNAINIANNVLSALDVFEDDAQRDRVEGEARFIRGLLYFQLARLFGPAWHDGDPNTNLAVPVVTDPTRGIDDEARIPRNTVAEVYEQAISDLTAARDLLPPNNGFFANSFSASAILARVYLSQSVGNNAAAENAAREASRVIEDGDFSLMGNYADAFNQPTNVAEYVFAIEVTSQDGFNSLNEFYGTAPGRGDIDITPQHMARYDENDERADYVYLDGDGILRTEKWATGPSSGSNIPVVRLAEMYLVRAEANLRAGTVIGAPPSDDVNEVRERAGASTLGSVTLQDVRDERRRELAFEGHEIFDVKRFQETIGGDIPWNSPSLVYPVPQRELDANPNLVQNEGYGS